MIHGNHSNKNKAVFYLCHTKQKHKDTLHLAYISFRDWLLTLPKRNGGNIHHIFQLYRKLKASTSCTAFELHLASFVHRNPFEWNNAIYRCVLYRGELIFRTVKLLQELILSIQGIHRLEYLCLWMIFFLQQFSLRFALSQGRCLRS